MVRYISKVALDAGSREEHRLAYFVPADHDRCGPLLEDLAGGRNVSLDVVLWFGGREIACHRNQQPNFSRNQVAAGERADSVGRRIKQTSKVGAKPDLHDNDTTILFCSQRSAKQRDGVRSLTPISDAMRIDETAVSPAPIGRHLDHWVILRRLSVSYHSDGNVAASVKRIHQV